MTKIWNTFYNFAFKKKRKKKTKDSQTNQCIQDKAEFTLPVILLLHAGEGLAVRSPVGVSTTGCLVTFMNDIHDFTPISCRSRKSFFICIKLNIFQLCHVAGHAYILLPTVTVTCVTRNRQLSAEINVNEIHVALSLHVAGSVNAALDR